VAEDSHSVTLGRSPRGARGWSSPRIQRAVSGARWRGASPTGRCADAGTIGGSLAHADRRRTGFQPDALGADVEVAGSGGRRRVAVADFVRGAMEADLGAEELVVEISHSPILEAARFGFLRSVARPVSSPTPLASWPSILTRVGRAPSPGLPVENHVDGDAGRGCGQEAGRCLSAGGALLRGPILPATPIVETSAVACSGPTARRSPVKSPCNPAPWLTPT
jgi:hypothetical protein